jgi:hypothetical protein
VGEGVVGVVEDGNEIGKDRLFIEAVRTAFFFHRGDHPFVELTHLCVEIVLELIHFNHCDIGTREVFEKAFSGGWEGFWAEDFAHNFVAMFIIDKTFPLEDLFVGAGDIGKLFHPAGA